MNHRWKFAGPWLLTLLIVGAAGCASPLVNDDDDLLGDQSRRSSLFDIDKLPQTLTKQGKQLIGKGEDHEKARELYTEATEHFQTAAAAPQGEGRDEYDEAAKKFREAAERWPESALEQDALFMAGESYFFADRCPKANEQYELLLKKYPASRYLDTVEARRFSIAQYWLQLHDKRPHSFFHWNLTDRTRPNRDTFGHAIRVFDKIRIDDPTGKLADDATIAAGNAHFASARYIEADNFYTDLRKTFPSSEHQFRAHLLGVKAKLLAYEGPDYSGVALDEAEKLLKQINRQFPQYAAEEREYLNKAYAEVRFKKAEREWHMAQFYERRGEYGGARFYYDILAKDYTETPFGEQALARVGEIRDKPAHPPKRLEWLVDIFPREEDVEPLIATAPAASGGTTRR